MPVEAEMALHDEHIRTAHTLGEPRSDLAVRELHDVRLSEFDTEIPGYF
jgi:hypothetical protein